MVFFCLDPAWGLSWFCCPVTGLTHFTISSGPGHLGQTAQNTDLSSAVSLSVTGLLPHTHFTDLLL